MGENQFKRQCRYLNDKKFKELNVGQYIPDYFLNFKSNGGNTLNKKVFILIGLIVSTILVTGCIDLNNYKLVGEYNLTKNNDTQTIIMPLSEGVNHTKIEIVNMTKTTNSAVSLDCYALNIIPQEGKPASNYANNTIDYEAFSIQDSPVPLNRSLTLDTSNAKSILIVLSSGKGIVKVSTA